MCPHISLLTQFNVILHLKPKFRKLFSPMHIHVNQGNVFIHVASDAIVSHFAFQVPGHALHEKSLQRQIGVGTQVSSQEQIALLVALINRG